MKIFYFIVLIKDYKKIEESKIEYDFELPETLKQQIDPESNFIYVYGLANEILFDILEFIFFLLSNNNS